MTEPGAPGRIEQLIQALHDENEALREHAIASLGQTGPEALPRLIDLMADEDAVIREAATSAVVRMGPSVVAQMIDALQDDSWAIREQAASALGKLRDRRAVEPLVRAIKDRDGAVRTAAVWALERIGDSQAVPGLIDALMDSTLREDAARVLKEIGDVRAVEALIDGLLGSNWMVRRHAAEALGKIGDEIGARGPVVVTVLDKARTAEYQRLVQRLREADIRAELYLGNGKMGQQLKYADQRGSPCVVIQGPDEQARGEVQIKDLIEGQKLAAAIKDNVEWRESRPAQFALPEEKLVEAVREVLARHGLSHGR